MPDFISEFKKNIFNITQSTFEIEALKLFHYQREQCEVYKNYLQCYNRDFSSVKRIEEIPFLPVQFFKTHKVSTSKREPKVLFESSGTTGSETSKHLVPDLELYKRVALEGFERQFGAVENYIFLALLPSYIERKNSSLIYMVQYFIEKSSNTHSGFYLKNLDELNQKLNELKDSPQKIILIGVSFALLDLAEMVKEPLPENVMVMETGGMKGRRREMIREELHKRLREGLGVRNIYSEYGMTELLSQSYMTENGKFHAPEWLKILISEAEDPLHLSQEGRGVINVIDLANVDSCAFLQLEDVGNLYIDGSFEVLGRMDHSDVRGCNLMYI